MDIQLIIKINNQSVAYTSDAYSEIVPVPIRITANYPVINWSYISSLNVTVNSSGEIQLPIEKPEQIGYELRISTSISGIGTDNFIGNVIYTGFVTSKAQFWNYRGQPLIRGETYYGQLYIKDEFNRESRGTGHDEWTTFSFKYNSLSSVSDIELSPSRPLITDDIVLSYSFNDNDSDIESGTIIRWYKNYVHQKQFDNAIIIKKDFLQIGDILYAEIIPSDGYEYGVKVVSPFVQVSRPLATLSNIEILPRNPNENDILFANYDCSEISESDNVSIRWFVNDVLISSFNDSKTIRYNFIPGDTVRYDISVVSLNQTSSSETITILESDFIVHNLTIDGMQEPLEISTISPVIRWKTHKPSTKDINFVSIKIGTFYEANNIWPPINEPELGILEGNKEIFHIPANLLDRGIDYYVSVAVSDTNVFSEYTSSHFRTTGSEWESYVDNSVGWTIETLFSIDDSSKPFDASLYQIIRINDGTRFGEVRIHNNKIGFVSSSFTLSEEITTSGFNILTIVGLGNDIKIYLNKSLVLDGTGLLTQSSTSKKLELGNSTGFAFDVKYKYFYYTTVGAYFPDSSQVYSDIKFHKFLSFEDNEIVGLIGYATSQKEYKAFGVNPDIETEGGSVYAIGTGSSFEASTVSRTFSPINKIRISQDGKKIVFAHAKGASIVFGYTISQFDNNLDFITEIVDYETVYPDLNGWDLVRNTYYNAASVDSNGLNINTTL